MCTYFFALGKDENYPLIVAGNRDEFLNRATQGVHIWEPDFSFWPKGKTLTGGKDLESGGTWLGISEQRFAFVTNIRRPPFDQRFASTRGELPLRWLSCESNPLDFAKRLERNKHNYASFNLIYGEGADVHVVSSDHLPQMHLSAGLYGISNATLNIAWPKVNHGKKALESILIHDDWSSTDLFQLLENKRTYSENLPDTGVDLDKEKMLSALFVRSENYGTRASSVLLCGKNGELVLETKEF